MKNKNFIGRLRCILFLMALASSNYLSAQTGPNDDFDGDGISNYDDIDDDNDGILDILECPNFGSALLPTTAGVAWPGVTSSNITRVGALPTGITEVPAVVTRSYMKPGGAANYAGTFTGPDYNINTTGVARTLVYTFSTPIPADQLFVAMGDVDNNGGNAPQPRMDFVVNSAGGGTATAADFDFYKVGGTTASPLPWPGGTLAASTVGNAVITNGIRFTFNASTAGNDSRAIMVRGKTNKTISRLEITMLVYEQAYFYIGAFNAPCDTDADGVPNTFDLDSDGDGCPDAVEAGSVAKAGAGNTSTGTLVNKAADGGTQANVANAIVGTSGNYGTNGFYNGSESDDTSAATYTGTYTYGFATDKTAQVCTDTDADGIPDFFDIDDDNDGVPDAVESPSCFYAASEWNTGVKPATNGVTITSALTTTLGNFGQLLDNVPATTAVTFTAGQPIQNANVYLFTFAQAVRLDAVYLKFNTLTQFGGTTKIQGSNTNNGSDWVDLSAATSTVGTNVTANGLVEVTNSIKYPVTLNTATSYRYIRITGVAVSNTAAQNASEVYFDFNVANYVASHYPKATCTDANIDGDGILPHLDLDSDGDGCSDAYEAGATTNLATNYKFTGAVGVNGLDNTLETSDNGIINYASTYYVYAQNSVMQICKDTDGDGILDINDIDDDNDGVLDTAEQVLETCSGVFTADSRVIWNSTFTNSNTTATGNATINGTPVSVTATTTKVFQNLMDDHWHYGSGTYVGYPDVTTVISNSVLNIQNNDYTVTYTFSRPVRNPSLSFSSFNGTAVLFPHPVYVSGLQGTVAGVSSNSYITSFPATENTVAVLYNGVFNSISFRVAGSDAQGSVLLNIPYVLNAGSLTYTLTSGSPFGYLDIDTDGDGIVNRLDLDSDGDGCPDAREAGVSSNAGASASMSASGGTIYTGGIPTGTANAYVGNGTPGQYGANGLFNDIETGENGVYNSNYTYQYAINNALNACIDTDGDGVGDLIDIDDDNDGILDITEVQCTTPIYTSKSGVTVSSTITWNGALSLLVDGADTANQTYPNGVAIAAQTVLQFDLPSAKALKQIELSAYSTQTAIVVGAVVQMQGWNGVSWENIGSQITVATPTTGIANPAQLSYKFSMPANLYSFTKYRIYGVSGNVQANWLQEAYFSEICVNNDTDGDGIPNIRDLDSDGDGCPDAVEAGVSSNSGASASMSTSGGAIYTGGIPTGTANAYLGNGTPSQYGANGFFNGIETAVDSGLYNNAYTYAYATSKVVNLCADTDGDGINDFIDIDDDNDGVVDAVESPSCFYTQSEAQTITAVSSQLVSYSTYVPANAIDGDASTLNAFNPSVNWVGQELYRVTPVTPIAISSMQLDLVNWALSNGAANTFKMQGSTDGTSWTDLSVAVASTATTGTFTVSNSLLPNNVYSYYRLIGVAGTSYYGGVTEIRLIPNNYVASAHPKLTCVSDTDGDGILNHLDLDSDGDGCPDAVEAGVSSNAGAITSMSSSGGSLYTGGIPSGTAKAYVGNGTPSQYGANGFFNGIETAADNGIYNGTYTYSQYALASAVNACTDTDGDGVPDVFDLDDDNDGVLDAVECPTLFANMATDGGFSKDAAALPNWYMGLASATLPIAEPFTPTAITITNTGSVYNYGIGGANQTNSTLTGGLYDSLGGANAATGVQYVLQENDPFRPVVNKLSNALVAGVPYNYSFDLGNRASSGSANKYIVMLYNADTKMAEKIIETGVLNTLPAVGTTPSYKNFTGSFTPAASANYYLLFYPSISGGAADDFVIDRVAVVGAGAGACDIDNDGIPNYLDLDSDGDGCPDTKEAILYNHATEASIAADVKNGSGGVVTSTVNMPNAMVPGPYGSNGFADALQLSTNPDAYKYVYTYLFVATDPNVSTCSNKFLYDIDSDDDGIPDAVESPSCFYTEAQAMDITEGVTSDFGWTTVNPLTKTYDDITLATNYGEISSAATSIQNKALITFDLPIIDAAFVNSITLNVGGVGFGTGKWKLQGLDMMTNTWTDLSAVAGQAMSANTTYIFTNTLQSTTRYHSYRILGVDNVNIVNAARLIEFSIQYKNYNASYHRTKMGCSSDADGDGVPNYIDRDSDGDGCPDAVEAGIPLSKLVPGDFFNIGGVVSGNYVTVGGNYGDNGLGDDVETAPDSGIVNYTSTYTQYATNKTLNFCTDTDGDSVPDLIDLDDDNDGILDTTECTYPALPTTTSTADVFATWSNTTTAAGTNGAPTYLTSVGSWTAGAGLTAAISGGTINISNVNGSTLGDAFGANEYLEHPFTTTADNYNSLYYIRSSASNATNYHWAMLISDDNFVTYTILNIDMLRNATGVAINDINDYQLKPSTAYKVRTYYWGAPAFTFDEFTMFGYSECDTDSDGVPNRLDLDSDGDGCPDAKESGVAANSGATASMSSSGGSIYTGGIASGTAEAYVGNGTPAQYGNNGFFNGIETAAESGLYNGTYTYASAINATISACFCYKPAITAGTVLDTHHGITSLQRAGTDNSDWPMVRKGAWTALESKTKAFVPNRLTITEINSIPVENLKEGMMVYNISSNCIYINTDGTASGWKCFNTQACP
ncbi:beta strand repeat-containing protein [Chryseobacterium sp.]|uniref:beta strand repeat-containing protein n=1 Tax=Chryseobacterium sp. TaxID=1871047 RepID=UPI002FCB3632